MNELNLNERDEVNVNVTIVPAGPRGERGPQGPAGLTVAVSVNEETYIQENGVITLPSYPTTPSKTSDLTNDSDFTTKEYVDSIVGDISTVLSTLTTVSEVSE